MISVSQSYVMTQKVHIERATNSTLFNLNSATKIGSNKPISQVIILKNKIKVKKAK